MNKPREIYLNNKQVDFSIKSAREDAPVAMAIYNVPNEHRSLYREVLPELPINVDAERLADKYAQACPPVLYVQDGFFNLKKAHIAGQKEGAHRAAYDIYWMIAKEFGSGLINPNVLIEEISKRFFKIKVSKCPTCGSSGFKPVGNKNCYFCNPPEGVDILAEDE